MNNVMVNGIVEEFVDAYGLERKPEKAFEALINYLVVSRIQPNGVETAEQILDIDVDENGGNFGIDGIAIFVDENIIVSPNDVEACKSKSNRVSFVFTQSKTSTNIEVGEISNFARAVQAFFKENQVLNYTNNMLKKYEVKKKIFERSFAKNISRESPECILYFAYAGNYQNDENVEEVIRQEIQNITNENPFLHSVRINIIDSKKIVSMYNESLNSIEIDIEFKDRVCLSKIDKINDVYYGLLSIDEYLKLIEDEDGNIRNNIFYENVRDYLGDENPVNSEIIASLSSPDMCKYFPVLNNGITLITRYIKPNSAYGLTIKDYQIVNGCQTSNAIYRCKKSIKGKEIKVPIKIIYTDDSNVIYNIIRANNKQSVVPEEAFIALGEFHKLLQEYYKQKSKTVVMPIYYERRSREVVNDEELHLQKEQIITLHAQIRAIISVYYGMPHLVYSNNPTTILKMKYSFFENDHKFSAYYLSSYIVANIRNLFRERKIQTRYNHFIYYIAMYFRVVCTGSIKAYSLSDSHNDSELNSLIAVLDDKEKALEKFKYIISCIDTAISIIKKSSYKYNNMGYAQIAALTAFEDELKKVYISKTSKKSNNN